MIIRMALWHAIHTCKRGSRLWRCEAYSWSGRSIHHLCTTIFLSLSQKETESLRHIGPLAPPRCDKITKLGSTWLWIFAFNTSRNLLTFYNSFTSNIISILQAIYGPSVGSKQQTPKKRKKQVQLSPQEDDSIRHAAGRSSAGRWQFLLTEWTWKSWKTTAGVRTQAGSSVAARELADWVAGWVKVLLLQVSKFPGLVLAGQDGRSLTASEKVPFQAGNSSFWGALKEKPN